MELPKEITRKFPVAAHTKGNTIKKIKFVCESTDKKGFYVMNWALRDYYKDKDNQLVVIIDPNTPMTKERIEKI